MKYISGIRPVGGYYTYCVGSLFEHENKNVPVL